MNKNSINLETAIIPWHDLQRFFASGKTIVIANTLDLVEVASQFAQDNKPQVEKWIVEQSIAPVSDQQALKWYENNVELWAVVVKPWVLVQEQQ